jgi:tRNA pseudouridine32 synthase / 23S rRNA pseudouridine746 synthase
VPRRSRTPPSPLPQRGGLDAVRLRLPADPGGAWPTLRDHLRARFSAAVGAERVDAMLRDGLFVGRDGRPWDAGAPYAPGAYVWFHRPTTPEPLVPFPIGVVHRDERIVVADKPHFLATTPRGRHVTQTALARLRTDLVEPALQPAHRLDRLTAGLVLFVVRPEDRGAYQRLFAERRVHKVYEAVAPHAQDVMLPRTVRSRIEKEHGIRAAREVPGEPNAETLIERTAHGPGPAGPGTVAGYRLTPATGRTHQLRVHMSALGLPLLNDPLFPPQDAPGTSKNGPEANGQGVDVQDGGGQDPDDWSHPLQLLAKILEFTDPLTGEEHHFESTRRLAHWPAPPNTPN